MVNFMCPLSMFSKKMRDSDSKVVLKSFNLMILLSDCLKDDHINASLLDEQKKLVSEYSNKELIDSMDESDESMVKKEPYFFMAILDELSQRRLVFG